ncbi:MAG: hypothetical protein R2766_09500 [Saprospiraceae bacterium]
MDIFSPEPRPPCRGKSKSRLVFLNEKNRKAVNTSSWTFLVLNRDLRVRQ